VHCKRCHHYLCSTPRCCGEIRGQDKLKHHSSAGATTLNDAITTNAVAFKDQLAAKGGALASVTGSTTTVAPAAGLGTASAAKVTATPSMLVVSVLAMLGMIKSM